ncbi:MAG: cbb3-type cytochrome c oxidase subunit I [Flavobacteriales bacterium]|nr:cbb3-type cytochrome c oxidase subunit I [Flavobacteriales bacterium]
MKGRHFSYYFLALGLISLGATVLFGFFAALQYVIHDFLKGTLDFSQMRPLHVTSAVSWIVLTATGGIYFYLSQREKVQLFQPWLGKLHLALYLITGICIYITYSLGLFGGREYFVFVPFLLIPILLGWVLFGINYFKSMLGSVKDWPVYYWMWGTGICFMTFHICEAHFWLFDFFRTDYLKDFSVTWKSYGSFVGSWNLLVYGTAIYLMARIKGDESVGRGKLAFFFYFLGLTNLMFGWAHHIYIVPIAKWVRYLSYLISMTEWIILIHIITTWKKSLSDSSKLKHVLAMRFLISADYWILGNLFLALLISIPALNLYSHGTHFTVAHSMGTTIGINTSILFASLSHVFYTNYNSSSSGSKAMAHWGHFLFNISLLVFLLILVWLGVNKSIWQYFGSDLSFSEFQDTQYSWFILFVIAGALLGISILWLVTLFLKYLFQKTDGATS